MSAAERLPAGLEIDRLDVARDLDGVLAVDAASFVNHWTREMFLWEAEHSDVARVFVCRTAAGMVVAYCAVWLIFDELHVNNLAVLPDWRRRGVARGLLRAVLAAARREGGEKEDRGGAHQSLPSLPKRASYSVRRPLASSFACSMR
mgnify:CR=1 FL=1